MNFLTKNLEVLRSKRPELSALLEPYLADTDAHLFQEPDGCYNLNYTTKDDVNKNLYSQSYKEEYARSLKLSKIHYPKILVFNGIGLGNFLFEYFKTMPKTVREIIILEDNPVVFLNALKLHDFSDFFASDSCQFFVGLKEDLHFTATYSYFTVERRLINSGRIQHFYFQPALASNGQYYLHFSQMLQKAAEEVKASYLPPPEDNFQGLLNISKNLSRLKSSANIEPLKDIFRGRPGIVISSGPSLKFHLAELKKNQKKFIVAACDSSVKALLEHGIVPDFVFCIERLAAVDLLLQDLPSDLQIPLVTLPTVYPVVYKKYPGPVIMLSRSLTFGKWLWPEQESFTLGMTVATMAFRILFHMGCRDIYLLGQDLSYDRHTKSSHFAGVHPQVQAAEENLHYTREGCELVGNDGQSVPSNIYWRMFVKNFETMILQLNVNCYNVIPQDCGAKISGAIRLDPETFWTLDISRFLDIDVVAKRELIKSHLHSTNSDFFSLLVKTKSYLDQMIASCLQLTQEVSQLYLDDMPLTGDEDEIKRYEGYFAKWQRQQKELLKLDPKLYADFLNCVFASTNTNIFLSLESLAPQGREGIDYLTQYTHLTLDWFKELMSCCMRAKHILENAVL